VNKVTTLGIDLAKTVFQLHGVDLTGKVVWRREVRRAQLMKIVAQLEPCAALGAKTCHTACRIDFRKAAARDCKKS
jgi:transposase